MKAGLETFANNVDTFWQPVIIIISDYNYYSQPPVMASTLLKNCNFCSAKKDTIKIRTNFKILVPL